MPARGGDVAADIVGWLGGGSCNPMGRQTHHWPRNSRRSGSVTGTAESQEGNGGNEDCSGQGQGSPTNRKRPPLEVRKVPKPAGQSSAGGCPAASLLHLSVLGAAKCEWLGLGRGRNEAGGCWAQWQRHPSLACACCQLRWPLFSGWRKNWRVGPSMTRKVNKWPMGRGRGCGGWRDVSRDLAKGSG